MAHKLMPCKSNAHFVRKGGCAIISSLLMTHDDKRSLLPRPSPGSRIWAHDVVARILPAPHRLRSSHRQPAPGVDRSSCKDSRRRFIVPSSWQPQVYNSATTMTATTCGSKRSSCKCCRWSWPSSISIRLRSNLGLGSARTQRSEEGVLLRH